MKRDFISVYYDIRNLMLLFLLLINVNAARCVSVTDSPNPHIISSFSAVIKWDMYFEIFSAASSSSADDASMCICPCGSTSTGLQSSLSWYASTSDVSTSASLSGSLTSSSTCYCSCSTTASGVYETCKYIYQRKWHIGAKIDFIIWLEFALAIVSIYRNNVWSINWRLVLQINIHLWILQRLNEWLSSSPLVLNALQTISPSIIFCFDLVYVTKTTLIYKRTIINRSAIILQNCFKNSPIYIFPG